MHCINHINVQKLIKMILLPKIYKYYCTYEDDTARYKISKISTEFLLSDLFVVDIGKMSISILALTFTR